MRLFIGHLRIANLLIKLIRAVAVLGRQRNRVAQPQFIGLVQTGLSGTALGLIGSQHDRHIGLSEQSRKQLVFRQNADARIGQHQHHISLGNRRLGLRPHTRLKRAGLALFKTGRVDNLEA